MSELPVPDKLPDTRWRQWCAYAPPFDIFPTEWSVGGIQKRNGTYGFFGPELYTGKVLADLGQNVGLIKYAHGGSALAETWLPALNDDYPILLQVISDALADLDARGIPWVWGGFIWVGSEGDASHEDWAAAWTENMETFIAALRTDLGVPDLSFFIWRLSTNQDITYRDEVYDQETVYPDTHPNVYVMNTNDMATIDGLHYGTPGQTTGGTRCANQINDNI